DDGKIYMIYHATQKKEFSESPRLTYIREIKFIKDIPVIPSIQLDKYADMLHFAIYNKIAPMKLALSTTSGSNSKNIKNKNVLDSHGSRESEKFMLQNVKDGVFLPLSENPKQKNTHVGILSPGNPLRQAQDMIIIQTALVTRAAVEGGMDPEAAYTLSDMYIQQIEISTTVEEVFQLSEEILYNFTNEVHKAKQAGYSSTIKHICSYIDQQITNNIRLDDLAQSVGYDKYYISRIFHKETGLTINEYILQKKIDKAKILISSTTLKMQDISDQLHFCSAAYFTKQFKKATGFSPAAYRKSFSDM
ncbi:AraC family transcriptional regulator, partial [Pseudobutyrivibrio sp.]